MKNLLSTCILLVSLSALSQNKDISINKHFLKGNLLFTPSISYELGLNTSSALKFEAGSSLTIFDRFDKTSLGFFSKFESQYKFYYNLKKRAEKGKNTTNNSANFFALTGIYNGKENLIGKDDRISEVLLVGPVWGIQRSYDNRLSFLIEVGLGYDFGYKEENNTNGRPFPIIGLELGWIIF